MFQFLYLILRDINITNINKMNSEENNNNEIMNDYHIASKFTL
jgi:hypothetical protein